MNFNHTKSLLSHSYLLRIWEESPGQGLRVCLKNVANGEQIGFADLETLIEFLKKQQRQDVLFEEVKRPYSSIPMQDLQE